MSSGVFDLVLLYNFIKKLVTPFSEWDAFKTGVIDIDGQVITKDKDRTSEQSKSWGYYDRLVANLKKLLAKVPGGKTRLASFAAALLLLKEEELDPNDLINLEEKFNKYFNIAVLYEEGIVNSVGSGNIAGIGVGPQGEPGVKNKKQKDIILALINRLEGKNEDLSQHTEK